jgi:exopolysaccharide biosynthesis protein
VAAALGAGHARSIAYDSFKYGNHFYHVVAVNPASCSVKTVHQDWLTSVHTMVDRSQPKVAITGTFFSPGSQKCVADVEVDGKMVATGARGTTVAVDYYGKVSIFDEPFNSQIDWSLYQFGLRGAVRVVDGGRVAPDPKAQRFHDPAIWGSASRTGLGLNKAGKVLLFATPDRVTLSEFGKAMKSRGVRNGVSLDGGASTCMYYNGTFVVAPHRKLCNLLVVSEKP